MLRNNPVYNKMTILSYINHNIESLSMLLFFMHGRHDLGSKVLLVHI